MSIKIVPPGPTVTLVPAASASAYGLVTSPSGGSAIAQITAPPPGTYQVTVAFYLTGTVTGSDQDNMTLQVNGVSKLQVLEPGVAAGATDPQSHTIVVAVPSGNITVNAIGAGGVACQYHVSLIATRIA
jgi:hypothetical protein